MTTILAVIQSALDGSVAENVDRLTFMTRDAAAAGAQIVLLPELFEGPYFCQTQEESAFALAKPAEGHPTLEHFSKLCKDLEIVMPVSFFERAGQACFNSVAMIDADGTLMGIYRKSHVPDGPGYQEKFYFRAGDTGFKVWRTRYGAIGVGICWDQWFPECARAMVLQGADVLLYPTAIGSEPHMPGMDTCLPWQRVMQGHAVANACMVAAANRVGQEKDITFYGSSFVSNPRGDKVAELNRTSEGFALATFELDEVRQYRDGFGFFRDRRPDLYTILTESTPS